MKTIQLTMVASIMGMGMCSNLKAMPLLDPLIEIAVFNDNDKSEFRKKINKRLDDLDKKIDVARADMKKAGKKAGKDYNKEMEKLKAARKKLHKKLDTFSSNTKDNWEDFKKNVEDESNKFQNEVDAFVKKAKN